MKDKQVVRGCRTVEGHPIVRDGEYESRGGEKVTVLAIDRVLEQPVIWYSDDAFFEQAYANGRHIWIDRDHNWDIMRPWKDTSVAEEVAERKAKLFEKSNRSRLKKEFVSMDDKDSPWQDEPKKQTLWDAWATAYPVAQSSEVNTRICEVMEFISDYLENHYER